LKYQRISFKIDNEILTCKCYREFFYLFRIPSTESIASANTKKSINGVKNVKTNTMCA